jgi:hypothetical protein
VLVVGAGAAGLGAATALAGHAPVTVVDRAAVPGGVAGPDGPDVRAAVAAAERAGVVLRLGATATRWEGGRLLVCRPGEIAWHPAAALLVAAGVRPATAAELGLTGERPAGVLPITAARPLLDADPGRWRRVLVLGDGFGAAGIAALVAAAGGTVTTLHDGWRGAEVVGRGHVTGLRTGRELVGCDALLLAAGARPVRTIEGAVADDAGGVVFLQDLAAASFADTLDAAATRVRRFFSTTRRRPSHA